MTVWCPACRHDDSDEDRDDGQSHWRHQTWRRACLRVAAAASLRLDAALAWPGLLPTRDGSVSPRKLGMCLITPAPGANLETVNLVIRWALSFQNFLRVRIKIALRVNKTVSWTKTKIRVWRSVSLRGACRRLGVEPFLLVYRVWFVLMCDSEECWDSFVCKKSCTLFMI